MLTGTFFSSTTKLSIDSVSYWKLLRTALPNLGIAVLNSLGKFLFAGGVLLLLFYPRSRVGFFQFYFIFTSITITLI